VNVVQIVLVAPVKGGAGSGFNARVPGGISKLERLKNFERSEEPKAANSYLRRLQTNLLTFDEYTFFYSKLQTMRQAHGSIFVDLIASLPHDIA
jgi:hypothetical protein